MSSSRAFSSGHSYLGLLGLTSLSILVALAIAPTAVAQGFGPDPYRPYNSRFDPFVYPVAPGPLDYGNNLNVTPSGGVRGANQFENYLNSLRGSSNGGPRGSGGAGMPYYQANRAYDSDFDREYRPNRKADADFEAKQESVTNFYFKYLREKDPQKRAELFRQYTRAKNLAERELAGARGRSRGGQGAKAAARKTKAAKPGPNADPNAPPPISSAPGTRRSSGGTATDEIDSEPPPISGIGRSPTPSQVLDRATGSDRTAPSAAPRGLRGPSRRNTPPPPPL